MNSLFEFIRPEMLPVSSGGEMCPEELKSKFLNKKIQEFMIKVIEKNNNKNV